MIKWAIVNGNWADGTTWNDGVVPVSGDYVYCNGYTISFPTQINIGNGTITNELNPNTNRNGGHIQSTSGGVTIVSNLIADGELIFKSGHLGNSIIGDVKIRNCTGMSRTGNTLQSTWRYTGNISVENGQITTDSGATYQVIITGNATLKNRVNFKQPANFTINGNIMIDNYDITTTNLTINGLLTAIHCRAYGSNVVKSGNIHYVSDNSSLTIGIAWQTLNISNISEWRDISEPRSNPFIILTDAEMNNRQQYPAPANVKKDIPYAWGELIGLYLPDYPPETVVLKDYIYDSGNKTGKLVVLPAELISRLLNCPTIETMQQLLIAHLNSETD